MESRVLDLSEGLSNLPDNAEQNTVPVDVDELHETVESELNCYQNLKAIMECYKKVTVTIKGRMNVRKSSSELNTYLDKINDHQNDLLINNYFAGSAMNSVKMVCDEFVTLIETVKGPEAAAAAATVF
ncbi:MAG: hypothetical protein GY696_16480 [Gammaproteobacteria bacterium]|nr:hypothetical protein [Gammaproteobacteria bacterium]